MLLAENLSKTFTLREKKGLLPGPKKQVYAVKDVSMRLEKGQIVGLLGINGAGKTTTIKMLTTLLLPTGGSYTLDGIDAVKRPLDVKRRVNMVAGGERMIYWRLTARENLWYFGQLYDVPKQVLAARIPQLLRLVGLEGKENVPVETFSKGMKQRLQIARGLVNDPEYLFMDEPTIGLDAVVAKELRQHVQTLAKQRGKGILLTSHYLGEVEELCDYIYVLDAGRVVHQGSAKQLTRETFAQRRYHLRTAEVYPALVQGLQEVLLPHGAQVAQGTGPDMVEIRSSENISRQLSTYCAQQGLLVREMREIQPTLEDTILHMAKEAAQ